MSDLIERLRNSRNWNIEIHYEAADEIERLTTQLGKANERLATLEAVSIENHQRAYEADRRLDEIRKVIADWERSSGYDGGGYGDYCMNQISGLFDAAVENPIPNMGTNIPKEGSRHEVERRGSCWGSPDGQCQVERSIKALGDPLESVTTGRHVSDNPEREQSGKTGGDRPDSYRAGEKPYTADGESGGIDSDKPDPLAGDAIGQMEAWKDLD